jgi:hypothetical protein
LNLPPVLTAWARRMGPEAALLVAAGLVAGVVGPFGSDIMPAPSRYPYWLTVIIGGGVIGVLVDEAVARRLAPVPRVLVASILMTPLVTLLVIVVAFLMLGQRTHGSFLLTLVWQVFAISLPLMAVRALLRRPPRVETRTVVEPPLPEAEAAFRRRLSAKRRTAGLIAIEAHDHYLRVHTDQGSELITLRMADALAELERAHGYRVHRSWWVAADAIESVRWRKGAGEAVLAGGLTAPVSRSMAPILREAGWR